VATQTGAQRRSGSDGGLRGGTGAGAHGAASIEAGLEKLLEPALYVVVGVLAVAFVLPLAVGALPVLGALWALRTRSWRLRGEGRWSPRASCPPSWPSCGPT
jgi:hypothetical protein